jgi:glycosyltransferase involved in cell wall biosynthesis
MTETDKRISIIVASLVGGKFLDDCLDSIRDQAEAHAAEVIVVSCGSRAEADRIAARHPAVKLIHQPKREPVPALRRRALDVSSGEIIAIIEEHCIAGSEWLAAAAGAINAGAKVVGGAVSPDDYGRRVDWVVYFCEYNISLPPAPRGAVEFLNGANIAYDREVLARHSGVLADGYWEAVLHPLLLAEGVKFQSVPEMDVKHRGPFPYSYYLNQRYWFSRAYAGARNASAAARGIYALTAPILPFVLLARMASRVSARGMHTAEFVKTIPLILPALVVYVAGEWVGYVAGPGDALSHVE